MPVFPLVPSMTVAAGLESPFFSASSIILKAIRSLMEWPGLKVSTFAHTVAFTPCVMRFKRMSGVFPIAPRMLS
jgi:hypothetical protein